METFELVEANRGVLFKLACAYKLADQSVLYTYLHRDNHSSQLETIYCQLSAMKVLFGALTGTRDKAVVAQMTPPARLEGRIIEDNMVHILEEIHKTGLVRLVGLRARNCALKKQGCSDAQKMVKPIMGLVNQATTRIFGFTYQASKRIQTEGQRYCSWEQTPLHLISGLSIVDVAHRSALCTDLQTPGHPVIPLPPNRLDSSCLHDLN
jgi:hypothetical protein